MERSRLMYSNAYVWSRVLTYLENHSPAAAIATYFDEVEVVELDEKKLVIYTPTSFCKDLILNRYAFLIKDAMREQFEKEVELTVLDEEDMPKYNMNKRKRNFVEFN